jgi:SAM-dependent methyltransferase
MFTNKILKRLNANNNERNNSEYWDNRVKNFTNSSKVNENLIWRTSKEHFDHWDNIHKSTIKLHYSKGWKLLDIGCGYGRYHEFITKLNMNYFGIDTSKNMIDEAIKYNKSDKFKIYNGTNIPFNDNEFDMIISVLCLSSINNTIEDEMIRVVKPNRPILILDENYISIYWK